ncbi:hypothetical protein BGX34_008557 [Mortierella sp. NVP85]|nr:hypothetical protein BGX34_008557 [Mortierella sp. NVP85]
MNIDMDKLSLSDTLKTPVIPIAPLLTPPLEETLLSMGHVEGNSVMEETEEGAGTSKIVSSSPAAISAATSSRFPIQVVLIPNRGRAYIATRKIQPQELVLVAEPYGATICDSWLDCGVCHYCWTTIQDRKAQIRLPKNDLQEDHGKDGGGKKKQKQETVMVFCDETCHSLYGPALAQWVCQVEQKIRRKWQESDTRHWKLVFPTTFTTLPVPGHYSTLVREALRIANTRQELLQLNDQDLTLFLNCVWGALDGLIEEQLSVLVQDTNSSASTSQQQEQPKRRQRQQPTRMQRYEAVIPKLMAYLLTGGSWANIAARTADSDCETIRFVCKLLYRRELELRLTADISSSSLPQSTPEQNTLDTSDTKAQGDPVTFADYCSIQMNELSLLRQQLKFDMENTDIKSADPTKSSAQGGNTPTKHESDHSRFMIQWRQLVSLLPTHLLGCFYMYLRMRDAFLLLALESQPTDSAIIPSIDNTLFRRIAFSEVANSFGIWDPSFELFGYVVYPRASFFNHSCRPNIDKKRRQSGKLRQMEYWSARTIEAGEECCISYGDILVSRKERQDKLEEGFFFRCSCVRCQEEEAAEQEASKSSTAL